ncbi:glycosyltransferase family A protein [Rhodohalobacter sp.]|uniref:glycosyltransferase family A protein n=1 Tax=Rhodohalobacter sp. TaxID=1974210 RepID=UPI002ACED917|nr:glycosyltransferase family A protein [Rhodohalobacter sp.]MDZ7757188.1 glycosyltransferase family A protein [Rhodohalobacter sp.]
MDRPFGSLLEQSRPPEEIIVVDDGSTDRSTEIAQSFGEAVTVLSSGGGGAPKARNLGADYASGDALMFFDADDVLGPGVLDSLVNELEKNEDGIIVCPWFRMEKVDGKWIKRPRSCLPLKNEKNYLSGWITGRYHPPCSVLWSRTAYQKTGGGTLK